jgi:hypothetical protein
MTAMTRALSALSIASRATSNPTVSRLDPDGSIERCNATLSHARAGDQLERPRRITRLSDKLGIDLAWRAVPLKHGI